MSHVGSSRERWSCDILSQTNFFLFDVPNNIKTFIIQSILFIYIRKYEKSLSILRFWRGAWKTLGNFPGGPGLSKGLWESPRAVLGCPRVVLQTAQRLGNEFRGSPERLGCVLGSPWGLQEIPRGTIFSAVEAALRLLLPTSHPGSQSPKSQN